MTPDEIRKLKPGRDTDALVAKAMGWKLEDTSKWAIPIDDYWVSPSGESRFSPSPYTSDKPHGWAAMRECWEWLKSKGHRIQLYEHDDCWEARSISFKSADGDSAPHALALLVLLVAQAEGCCEAARQQ